MTTTSDPVRSRRRKAREPQVQAAPSATAFTLTNPFPRMEVFSADEVASLHNASLRVLEELGIRILLQEARDRFRDAGAIVDEESLMVRIGREIIEEALSIAPPGFTFHSHTDGHDMPVGGRSLMFGAGAGCPNITDLERGRRPGSMADFCEGMKLIDSFPMIPKLTAVVEPQDIPIAIRHLHTTRAQLSLSDKMPFAYARGQGQVLDCFEMVRIGMGLSEEEFRQKPCLHTVINTNSPRQIDIPMAQGLIDFAERGQVAVVTPFCLSGAMAPITIAGALTLSHAEALAGITLTQLVRPGTPVVYGAFSSNVDMRSGAPVFGTPEHMRTNFGAGQLARHVGLPWRSAAGTAANTADAQATYENQLALWGCLLGGANMIFHSAGWLEGGLTFSMEKFVTDHEVLQVVAAAMQPVSADLGEIAFDAIAEVEPGGHFFAAAHTMERYRTAFYETQVSDWSNFGQWTEAGGKTATERAHEIWKQALSEWQPPARDPAVLEALDAYVAKRTEEGGASPVD
ncbi:MAG: trimethylamine methyltransferase family protein [Pseudomonadota bacterium]